MRVRLSLLLLRLMLLLAACALDGRLLWLWLALLRRSEPKITDDGVEQELQRRPLLCGRRRRHKFFASQT